MTSSFFGKSFTNNMLFLFVWNYDVEPDSFQREIAFCPPFPFVREVHFSIIQLNVSPPFLVGNPVSFVIR